MSERQRSGRGSTPVRGRQPGAARKNVQSTRAEKRAAAKAAAARAAAARRRRQLLVRTLAGLAAVAVVVGLFIAFRDSDDADKNAGKSAGSQTSASPEATGATATFPPLPAGADPALRTKPSTSAGTGDVTQLKVTALVQGTGAAAQAGQQVTVNYVGVSYKTGAEFDASWKRAQTFTFRLGQGEVIKGWDQGLAGIKVGSRVQLDIPSNLAYGDNPGGGRPGGPLRFIIDLLSVQ